MLQVPFSALKLLGGQPAHRSLCHLSHKGSLQNKWRKKTDGEQVHMENSWQTGGRSLFMKQNICHKQQTDLHPLFYDNHGELVLYLSRKSHIHYWHYYYCSSYSMNQYVFHTGPCITLKLYERPPSVPY